MEEEGEGRGEVGDVDGDADGNDDDVEEITEIEEGEIEEGEDTIAGELKEEGTGSVDAVGENVFTDKSSLEEPIVGVSDFFAD